MIADPRDGATGGLVIYRALGAGDVSLGAWPLIQQLISIIAVVVVIHLSVLCTFCAQLCTFPVRVRYLATLSSF